MENVRSAQVAAVSLSAAANVILNSLVMVVIARTPKLREDRTTLFMFSLATSDLAFGSCIMTTSAIMCSHPEIPVDKFASGFAAVSTWLTLTSLYNLCCISLCKMVAVVYPLRYLALVTERRCYILIFLNWTVSLILAAPVYFVDVLWDQDMCFVRLPQTHRTLSTYVIIMQLIGGLLPMSAMIVANWRIFLVVVRATHRVAAQGSHISEGSNTFALNQQTLASSIHKSVRASRNIIVICLVYICVVAVGIAVTTAINLQQRVKTSAAEFVVLWLFFSNTSINSLLYMVLYRSVRTALTNVLRWS
ncbi:hypothetical protein LSAT2_005269 [Lamellibrachia satsuma]|nr:hypothetical protein LSAT2_005269 [Lamellibrachia satsuma]